MGCRLMRHQIRGHRVAGSPLNWPTKSRASPRPGVKRTTGIHEITRLAIALAIVGAKRRPPGPFFEFAPPTVGGRRDSHDVPLACPGTPVDPQGWQSAS